ncbi:hypothetical protein, partial [Nostoc flagelliforme]|uniref:hypothetical protein n=1 Tax=Nostoc flagelliforme TaxID=1306274 RepID=UPI001A7E8EC4
KLLLLYPLERLINLVLEDYSWGKNACTIRIASKVLAFVVESSNSREMIRIFTSLSRYTPALLIKTYNRAMT